VCATVVLSDKQAAAMNEWVTAASAWAEAAQALVGSAATMALASRSLADAVDGSPPPAREPDELSDDRLGASLRSLATEVEDESAGWRDRYLATAANLEQYQSILGENPDERA
jgi:hypothetical protein